MGQLRSRRPRAHDLAFCRACGGRLHLALFLPLATHGASRPRFGLVRPARPHRARAPRRYLVSGTWGRGAVLHLSWRIGHGACVLRACASLGAYHIGMTKWLKRRRDSEIAPEEIFLDAANTGDFDHSRFEGRLEQPLSRTTYLVIPVLLYRNT